MKKGFDEPDNKSQKNARVNRILERLLKRQPSMEEMEEYRMFEPEYPTFPSPAQKDLMRKKKKSPFL